VGEARYEERENGENHAHGDDSYDHHDETPALETCLSVALHTGRHAPLGRPVNTRYIDAGPDFCSLIRLSAPWPVEPGFVCFELSVPAWGQVIGLFARGDADGWWCQSCGRRTHAYAYGPTGLPRGKTTEAVPLPYRYAGAYADPVNTTDPTGLGFLSAAVDWYGRGDVGPLIPGESLLDRLGFWSNYLLAMCSGRGAPSARFRSGSVRTATMSIPCPRFSSILALAGIQGADG
jgi:hypothetical protein